MSDTSGQSLQRRTARSRSCPARHSAEKAVAEDGKSVANKHSTVDSTHLWHVEAEAHGIGEPRPKGLEIAKRLEKVCQGGDAEKLQSVDISADCSSLASTPCNRCMNQSAGGLPATDLQAEGASREPALNQLARDAVTETLRQLELVETSDDSGESFYDAQDSLVEGEEPLEDLEVISVNAISRRLGDNSEALSAVGDAALLDRQERKTASQAGSPYQKSLLASNAWRCASYGAADAAVADFASPFQSLSMLDLTVDDQKAADSAATSAGSPGVVLPTLSRDSSESCCSPVQQPGTGLPALYMNELFLDPIELPNSASPCRVPLSPITEQNTWQSADSLRESRLGSLQKALR